MNQNPLFRGTATALVTPFESGGDLDESALRRLVSYQLSGGVDALVVLGTTGENPTVTSAERDRIVALTVDLVNGAIPVIVGTGTNDTATSVEYSRRASYLGADGLLVVGPYYNKPQQRGFSAHVEAIASATDCPIVLYNVPGRTGFRATASTILELARTVPSVVAVKEACGDLAQVSDILHGRENGLCVYSGDDELTLPMLALGGDGVVSVVSNVTPRRFGRLVAAGLSRDFATARTLHFELLALQRACFETTNPVPVKAMLADLGFMSDTVRLPLVGLTAEERSVVIGALRACLPLQTEFDDALCV